MTSTAVEQRREPRSLPELVAASKSELRRLLPDYDRFARVLVTEIRRTPKLAECTAESFLGAAFVCAQLGLEPGPLGDAWLIPRWNGRRKANECTFMLGYRGIEKLALRSGYITSIETRTVYEGDQFEVVYGDTPSVTHIPKFASETPKLWYALARRSDGTPLVQVLTPNQVEDRRACSATPDKGPWVDHYDAMARKSCIRALWQNLPLEARDPHVDRAVDADDQVLDGNALRSLTAGDRQVDTDTGEIVDAEEVEPDDQDLDDDAGEEQESRVRDAAAAAADGTNPGASEDASPSQGADRERPPPSETSAVAASPAAIPEQPERPPPPADPVDAEPDRRPIRTRAGELGFGIVEVRAQAEQAIAEGIAAKLPSRWKDLEPDLTNGKLLDALHGWLDVEAKARLED